MYFFKTKGRQILDLKGDLTLSHNHALIMARSKSAAPASVIHGTYIVGVSDLGFRAKCRASWLAVRFIWSKPDDRVTAPEYATIHKTTAIGRTFSDEVNP